MKNPRVKPESPIAATAESKRILKRLADELNMSQVGILDHALEAFEKYYDQHGQRALIPPRYDETFVVYKIELPLFPDGKNIVLRETLQPGESPNLESAARPSARKRHARTSQ